MFPFDMYVFNKKVRQVCGSNCLFERGWNKNHLVLSTFRDNLFDLNHIETFSSSAFILKKSVSMFLWDRSKLRVCLSVYFPWGKIFEGVFSPWASLNYLTNKSLQNIFFSSTNIAKVIATLNTNKVQHDYDKISIRMFNICGDTICRPLEIIFKQWN